VLERQQDELLKMTRAVHRTLGWFARTSASEIAERLRDYFPDVAPAIFAGAIERYRALGLWGSDPVIRREGYDRLHAAMRAAGALRRDIAFEACVDTKLAEQAIS
jgi:NitT/TauT family transport system substrate-binding protein